MAKLTFQLPNLNGRVPVGTGGNRCLRTALPA